MYLEDKRIEKVEILNNQSFLINDHILIDCDYETMNELMKKEKMNYYHIQMR